jgi:hypothetical protein
VNLVNRLFLGTWILVLWKASYSVSSFGDLFMDLLCLLSVRDEESNKKDVQKRDY